MLQMYTGVHFTLYSVMTVGTMEGHLVKNLNAASFKAVLEEICMPVI